MLGASTTAAPRLLAALDRPLQHDPEELRSRAEDLLSRPPYTDDAPGVFGRALAWLGEAVARVLQAMIDGIAMTGPLGAWIIAAIGALILALVVWRMTRGATLDRRAPEVPAGAPARSAASWRTEAEAHELAGRHGEALRCWYAAAVVALVERGTLDDVPGRTVRELDGEVARSAPGLAPAVEAAGERFEAVFYGGEQPTAEDVQVVRDAAHRTAAEPVSETRR